MDALTDEQMEEFANFKAAIDDETVETMEKAAQGKNIGIARRLSLVALARDAETLTNLSLDDPHAFEEMKGMIEMFENHAKGLHEAAQAAVLRMAICDCRNASTQPT